jgi:hypothetical protein
VTEARLAVVAQAHDTSGQAHRPHALQLVVAGGVQARVQRLGPVADRIPAAERVETTLPQPLQLRVTLADQLVGVRIGHDALPRAHSR